MIRLCVVLVTALLGGALVTGCGSSSSSSSTSAAPSATTSAAATSTGGAATSAPSGGAAAGAPSVQAAVAACKQSLAAAPTLSASVKSQLADICNKIATNPAEAQAAGRQVCAEIVKATVPAAEQTAALAACQTK